jgi:pimeloyl-ACP methyl ester carboxylesterase
MMARSSSSDQFAVGAKAHDSYLKGPAGRLHLEDGGAGGLPVVFIPSLAGTIRQWQSQADHLRRDRRAIIVELRGHGRSDPPQDGDYSLPAMANDVDAVVTALAVRRFILVGHCGV